MTTQPMPQILSRNRSVSPSGCGSALLAAHPAPSGWEPCALPCSWEALAVTHHQTGDTTSYSKHVSYKYKSQQSIAQPIVLHCAIQAHTFSCSRLVRVGREKGSRGGLCARLSTSRRGSLSNWSPMFASSLCDKSTSLKDVISTKEEGTLTC